MSSWYYFNGEGKRATKEIKLPAPPPWRKFCSFESLPPLEQTEAKTRGDKVKTATGEAYERGRKKGESFRIHTEQEKLTEASKEVLNAVNAAIYLRRPLLVTGRPGAGKTSLAHAIAYELNLGSVLTWPINARTTLQEGLYRYDAIARLQEREPKPVSEYITLGPVGTAFLPSFYPRVLLIDEIDKSDLNLPNDLLNLLEEGYYEIPELVREDKAADSKTTASRTFSVRTADIDIPAKIKAGKVICCEFPIIVMTSNGEREFPPAFLRRCLRVRMPDPGEEALKNIVKAHFEQENDKLKQSFADIEPELSQLIKEFKSDDNRATDQLLNTIYILTTITDKKDIGEIKELLFKSLNEDS